MANSADGGAARPADRRLLLLCIPFFWSVLYVYNAYLSVYARSLGASLSLVGIIVATYGFTQLVLRIPVGIASDRLGRRKPFVLAGALAGSVGCAAMLIAPEPWVLILGRGLAGVAAACWVTLSLLLVSAYPRDEVVRATSMATALGGIGMTLSSALGGVIADILGIQAPFWVGIGLGLFTALLVSRVREPVRRAAKPLSVPELMSVGAVPMVLLCSVLALFNQYISWAMTQGFVPIYAAELEATTGQLGLLMAAWQACFALVSFTASRFHARLGTRWSVVLGLTLTTLGTAAVPLTRSFLPLLASRLLHGAGQGIAYPVLMGSAVMAVGGERRGAAMGFFQAIYAIGMVAGPSISGVLGDHLGLTATFYATAGISLCSALAAVLLLPRRLRAVS